MILTYKLKSLGKGFMGSVALESRIQIPRDQVPIVLNVLLPFSSRVYHPEDLINDSIIALKGFSSSLKALIIDIAKKKKNKEEFRFITKRTCLAKEPK